MNRFTLGTAAVLLSLTAAVAQAQDSTDAAGPTPLAMRSAPWYVYLRSVAMQNTQAGERAGLFLRAINASGEGECEEAVAEGCHRLAEMILDVGGKAKRDAADFREYQRSAADAYQRACDLGYRRSCGQATNLRRRLERGS